jgi:hypothetical protein
MAASGQCNSEITRRMEGKRVDEYRTLWGNFIAQVMIDIPSNVARFFWHPGSVITMATTIINYEL